MNEGTGHHPGSPRVAGGPRQPCTPLRARLRRGTRHSASRRVLERHCYWESWRACGDGERLEAEDLTFRAGTALDRTFGAVLDDGRSLVDRSPAPLGERQQVVHVGDGVVALEVLACLPALCDRFEEDRGGGPKVGRVRALSAFHSAVGRVVSRDRFACNFSVRREGNGNCVC